MLALLVFSALGLISIGFCQATSPVTMLKKVSPVHPVHREVLTLNRCTDDVPNQFQVPDLLKYVGDIEDKKFQYLTSVLGEPLFEFSLIIEEPNCISGTFGVTVPMTNEGAPFGGKHEQIFLYFGADGSLTYLSRETTKPSEHFKTEAPIEGAINIEVGTPAEEEIIIEREILFDKENYCISRITEESISLNFCKSKCSLHYNESGGNLCVPRCCVPGTISYGSGNEVYNNCTLNYWAEWKPEISTNGTSTVHPQITVNDKIYEWNCPGDKFFESLIDKSSIRITSNGQVMLKNGNEWVEAFSGHMPYQFCIDGYWDQLETSVYDPRASSTILLKRCPLKEGEESRLREEAAAIRTRTQAAVIRIKIQIITIHIPCAIIYLIVLIVYGSIWDKHHAHGWTVLGFATSQFLSYVFIIAVLSKIIFEDNGDLDIMKTTGVCHTIGSMRHFFSISTYSWTLVLTFNVWEILSSIRPESSRSIGTRLICYVSFAIGVPAIVVFIALMLELFPPNENIIKPGYEGCVVQPGTPYMLYVGSIHILLYTANLLFAGLTFRTLWRAQNDSKKLQKSNDHATFRNKAVLVIKLLLVMGFSLIFEFILNFGELNNYSAYFGIMEAYRVLQAAGLFWTFVFGCKTQQHLREKFPGAYKKISTWRNNSDDVTKTTLQTKT
ncbi:unnamed protein product [Allacma fusca]|uniref:G-protein coupled receptors family 2 profile 2 domain-containing protein n=1 Tax=Allacma fusca TaxID=39272 RepID=A0A8J2KLJ7_9HEXA|nr:unnamed protein product [Allacma fusca]